MKRSVSFLRSEASLPQRAAPAHHSSASFTNCITERTSSLKHRIVLLVFTWLLLLGTAIPVVPAVHAQQHESSLKILAIGNSFSTDGLQHVWHLARIMGYEDVIIANMYIGSSGLEHHWANAQSNAPAYRYDKNEQGTWVRTPDITLQFGIQDEDWDLITMHQRGGTSGDPESFYADDRLNNLIAYIKKHRTNPKGRIGWQMTWAYETGSTRPALAERYDGDQMAMYNAIVHAVETGIQPHPEIDVIIPVGTALQNMRTSYIGDNLTRDGYHLSYNLGRYIAGLTWMLAVTGRDIADVFYVPNTKEIPGYYLPMIKEAVYNAVDNPFAITPSSYTERPDLPSLSDPLDEHYVLLHWEPTGCAYWNSRNTAGLSTTLISQANSTASNLCYFVGSSAMFIRDDIPPGSIIEVDAGFQYRPEGWISLATHETRPAAVTARRVVVDEAWWGNYQYRAFNVSFEGSKTDVRGREDEVINAFRIYIPLNETS